MRWRFPPRQSVPTRGRSTRGACRKCKCAGFRGPHAETSAFGSRASPSNRRKRSSSERRSGWRARWVPERPALTCGRVRRAARIAFARLDDATKRCQTCRRHCPKRLFASPTCERGGNVTRTVGGLDGSCVALFVFKTKSPVFFVASSVGPRRGLNSVQPRFVARFVSKPPRGWKKFRVVAICPEITGEPRTRLDVFGYNAAPRRKRRDFGKKCTDVLVRRDILWFWALFAATRLEIEALVSERIAPNRK